MFQLPESVKVGVIDYAVREDTRTGVGGHYGEIIYSEELIAIMAGQSPTQKEVTLWHEIFHAVMRAAGITEHDEQTVIALSYGTVQVLRDNPSLRQ